MKQSMNDNSRCYFHQDEVVVGVCPLCLNERLLVLAAKPMQPRCRRQFPRRDPTGSSGYCGTQGASVIDKKKQQHRPAAPAPPKIFAPLRWFFFNRRWKSDAVTSYHDVSSSHEDSFISIRFEDNGLCSWEKNAASKVSFENCKASWSQGLRRSTKEKNTSDKEHRHLHGTKWSCKETNDVVEHAPSRASLRWRRRIGPLFHLIKWKSSSKGNVCHVDGVKVRNGWIKTLTRRRTKETNT